MWNIVADGSCHNRRCEMSCVLLMITSARLAVPSITNAWRVLYATRYTLREEKLAADPGRTRDTHLSSRGSKYSCCR